MTCKIIMVSAYVATIAAALAFMGCNPCERVAHDSAGNEMCADSVIQSYELDGMWCTDANPGPALCLQVSQSSDSATARYLFSQGHGCFEHGSLTGGLEFSPDTDSDTCLPGIGYGLYSASGEWTATGIRLSNINQSDGSSVSESPDLELHYVR